MINPCFKKGFDAGDLRAEFRLRRTGEGHIITIGSTNKWELGVIGNSLEQALDRFKKAILRQAGLLPMATPLEKEKEATR